MKYKNLGLDHIVREENTVADVLSKWGFSLLRSLSSSRMKIFHTWQDMLWIKMSLNWHILDDCNC